MSLALDPEIERALDGLRGGQPPAVGDWKARRADAPATFAYVNSLVDRPAGVSTIDIAVPAYDGATILARWYTTGRQGTGPSSAALFLHGGAMILGSVDLYDTTIRNYVSASGVPMLAVDYRLAPEHRHPTPAEDCYAGLTWLAAQADHLGVDPGRITVMGDSAGGGLSAAVALMARDRIGPPIAQQILLYPMLDDREAGRDPGLASLALFSYDDNSTGWCALLGDAAGGAATPAYAAAARAADLAGLPPAYLEVGQVDILCDQDIAYARRLSAAGVAVELHVHPGAVHAFELYAPGADVSRRAMADRIRVMRSV
jgi:acetyl esterase/lipase